MNLEKVFSFNDGIIKSGIDENVRFIDIGANIGNHALYFTKELKVKKVVSFEPTDETYWILEKNIEINSLEDRVELHKVGISDCESHALATKYSMENLGGISLSETEKGGIQLITLDSMDFDNVYFIKIDVEGMEKRVLIGGINTIRKYHPYIMIESFPQSFSDVKAILEPEGYRYEVLSEGSDYLFIYDED